MVSNMCSSGIFTKYIVLSTLGPVAKESLRTTVHCKSFKAHLTHNFFFVIRPALNIFLFLKFGRIEKLIYVPYFRRFILRPALVNKRTFVKQKKQLYRVYSVLDPLCSVPYPVFVHPEGNGEVSVWERR